MMGGARAHSSEDPTTSQPADSQSTKIPTLRLMHMSTMRLGRRYRDAMYVE